MKTIPDNWTIQQKAFFAGLISGLMPLSYLLGVFERLSEVSPPYGQRYFDHMIALLESRTSRVSWDEAVDNCERLFK